MICAVLLASELRDIEDQIEQALLLNVDMIEIRIDGLSEFNFTEIKKLTERLTIPYIISLRSEWYSTTITPPVEGRFEVMEQIIELEPTYIDLEFPMDMGLLDKIKGKTIPILSMLDFEGMAKIAFDYIFQIHANYANIIFKISATPNSLDDLKTIWRWGNKLKKSNIKHSIIGVGRTGKITRIKSKELGNYWTYGRIGYNLGEPERPGMVSVQLLQKAFSKDCKHMAILSNTNCVNMEKIFQSSIDKENISAVYVEIPLIHYPELDQMILWINDGFMDGAFVTKKWRKDVTRLLDIKDVSVYYGGNCNVIKKDEHGLHGYNTYAIAIKHLLKPFIDNINIVYIEGIDILSYEFVGNLINHVEQIIIYERDYRKFEEFRSIFPEIIHAKDINMKNYDMVINCKVPDRGFENVLPISGKSLENVKVIIDPISQKNKPTVFSHFAKKHSITFIDGWDINTKMVAESIKLWFNIDTNVNIDHLEQFYNVIDFL